MPMIRYRPSSSPFAFCVPGTSTVSTELCSGSASVTRAVSSGDEPAVGSGSGRSERSGPFGVIVPRGRGTVVATRGKSTRWLPGGPVSLPRPLHARVVTGDGGLGQGGEVLAVLPGALGLL